VDAGFSKLLRSEPELIEDIAQGCSLVYFHERKHLYLGGLRLSHARDNIGLDSGVDMPEDLQLHQNQTDDSLTRSFFRPRFDDSGLEDAWMVERLDSFRRVNRRALWVMLLASLSFLLVDLLVLADVAGAVVVRMGFLILNGALIVGVGRVPDVRRGDAFLVVGGTAVLAVTWFEVMLKLPEPLIESYWMVTSAMLIIGVLVLIETSLSWRLVMSLLMFGMTLAAPFELEHELQQTLVGMMHVLIVLLMGWVAAWQVEIARRTSFARQLGVERERAMTVDLLRNILPVTIADRLLSHPGTIAERHSGVSVLFADIVGFTPWASSCEAGEVVEVLDQIFSSFDSLCDTFGVEKIKTIGDAYMAAGGVPAGNGGGAASVVRLALGMIDVVEQIPVQKGTTLQLRIGVHEGPVVAGVIGRRKFIYDLWGDTVNTAARMESHGVPGRVQVTQVVADQLGEDFIVEPRGSIEVKGKGPMNAFLVGLGG